MAWPWDSIWSEDYRYPRPRSSLDSEDAVARSVLKLLLPGRPTRLAFLARVHLCSNRRRAPNVSTKGSPVDFVDSYSRRWQWCRPSPATLSHRRQRHAQPNPAGSILVVMTYFRGFVHARGTVIHWSYVAFPLLRLLLLANSLLFTCFTSSDSLLSLIKKLNLRFSNTLYFYLCTCLYVLGSFSISSSIYLIRCQLLFYLLSSILLFLLFKLPKCNFPGLSTRTLSKSVHPDLTLLLPIHRWLPSHHLHVLQGSPDSV